MSPPLLGRRVPLWAWPQGRERSRWEQLIRDCCQAASRAKNRQQQDRPQGYSSAGRLTKRHAELFVPEVAFNNIPFGFCIPPLAWDGFIQGFAVLLNDVRRAKLDEEINADADDHRVVDGIGGQQSGGKMK